MTISILVQSGLDGLLLSLSGLGLLGRSRGKLDGLLPLLFAGVCLFSRLGLGDNDGEMAYAVLPVDHIVALLFLFLGVLLLNSLWFQKGEGHTFFGTVAAFALYLLLRELCLLLPALCGLTEPVWYLYGGRVLSLCLWLALWTTGALGWLREKLADGDIVICMVCGNTALLLLLLLLLFHFDLSAMVRWLPVTVGAVGLLAVGDGIAMLLRRHRLQDRRKAAMLEQYLPLVEELIEQVRARQHDFNNQMMAVAAAVSTARDLEEAQAAVTALLAHVRLDGADKELLKCDSKVIGGLLFGKVKQAACKRVRVEVAIAGAFLRRSLPEADWAEVIAILLDNAIEAASPGDVVYARASEEAGGLRFSVWNPHGALSNMEFVQMFRRGWSTKGEGGHGYGLYNVRQIVERHGGKILTGNDQVNGVPYITIGVLVPE
ncbi:ATP-binding protein [uncultured Oscillibacter sp.]|uniref:sensor histidine kinase n=1 Tax=uncultured Oscillibacter sp. TaxID=876091 RepID=UPI002805CB91|nr:ATP-binding protein [uncultured Oscillibacter sp.]